MENYKQKRNAINLLHSRPLEEENEVQQFWCLVDNWIQHE